MFSNFRDLWGKQRESEHEISLSLKFNNRAQRKLLFRRKIFTSPLGMTNVLMSSFIMVDFISSHSAHIFSRHSVSRLIKEKGVGNDFFSRGGSRGY